MRCRLYSDAYIEVLITGYLVEYLLYLERYFIWLVPDSVQGKTPLIPRALYRLCRVSAVAATPVATVATVAHVGACCCGAAWDFVLQMVGADGCGRCWKDPFCSSQRSKMKSCSIFAGYSVVDQCSECAAVALL